MCWIWLNFKTQFGSWRDGPAVKSISCSFRGPEFHSQHLGWVIHNHLQLQIQRDPKSLASWSTCAHGHIHIFLRTPIHIIKKNKSLFKKYSLHWMPIAFVPLEMKKVSEDWRDLQLQQMRPFIHWCYWVFGLHGNIRPCGGLRERQQFVDVATMFWHLPFTR